jgi:4-amino-4-deoxy-L-arabinose transferase-like glycosyltransferase
MNIILLLILLLGAFLRLYHLSSLPISLFGDEIDVGYHAWSLFTTGRDYLGNLLPTYIHSLSEWRAPLLMYLTAPFVGLLGPSGFSVRLPVALLGILNIYLIYHLANQLPPKKLLEIRNSTFVIGHVAAAALALTPWHIHYSRAAFEVTLLMALVQVGTLFYLSKKYFWAFLFFALTFYTYSIANLFVPLLVILLLFFYPPQKTRFFVRTNLIKILAIVLLLLPIGYQLTLGPAAGRFNLISLFNDKKVIEDVILQRTAPWSIGDGFEPLFHNKVFAYAATFGRSYLTSYSTEFLFISGDPNFRQSVSRFGQLLWISAPFLLLGLALAITRRDTSSRFILGWLLIAPVGSSLTVGGGVHATRLFVMLTPLILLTAIGFNSFWEYLIKRKPVIRNSLIAVLLIFLLINFAGFWHRYQEHYRFESAKVWSYGYEQIFTQLKTLDGGEGKVFINNTYDPSLYRFAFYTKLSPARFQKMFKGDVGVENILPGFSGFLFGERYYFGRAVNLETLQSVMAPGDLYLAVQGEEIPGDWDWSKNPPAGIQSLSTVYDVYGLPLMYLLKKTPSTN